MVQPRRSQVAERRPQGLDQAPPPQPLARRDSADSAAPATAPRPAHRRRSAPPPAPTLAPSPVNAPTAGAEMQLSLGTILVSLPVAFTVGQMLIDHSLAAMPQAIGWTAAVVVYKVATAPGNARGFVDWVGGSVNLGPGMRERLGIPDELPVAAPRPRTRGVAGWFDGLAADVRNLKAAQAARREFEEGTYTVEDGPAEPDARRASAGASPARSGGEEQDAEPVDYEAGGVDCGWLVEMNDEPDKNPHLAVVGPSGSGKSTLVLAALTARPGALVICTIKSKEDDPWGGFPAVRLTFDANNEPSCKKIGAAIRAVYKEMNARHADGTRPRVPMTLVVDEFTSILAELGDEYVKMFLRMWISGRSVGVRTIIMDPTFNVKGWGIEGRGDVRESILGVRCARDKSAHFFEWDASRNRPFNQRPIDTHGVPALAARGLPASRAWRPGSQTAAPAPAAAPAPPDDDTPSPSPAPAKAAAPERQRQAQATVTPAPAPEDDLFSQLLAASAPPAATAEPNLAVIAPERADRLAAILARQAAAAQPAPKPEPASEATGAPQQQSVTVDQPGGGTVVVNVQQTAGQPKGMRGKRREGAVNVKGRQKRLRQIKYYQDAAQRKVPFSRAYADAPAGEKGNSNEMHAVYKAAEKGAISAS